MILAAEVVIAMADVLITGNKVQREKRVREVVWKLLVILGM